MTGAETTSDRPMGAGRFSTTHWSVVLALADGESPAAAVAFERLCSTYWYPLYAYIRRRGYRPEDAQDLAQSFLLHLYERKPFQKVHPDKGRFRSFLLAALNLFLADQRDRQQARKRGGGREVVSIDARDAETRYGVEPVDDHSPDRLFERQWALTLLNHVLQRLEEGYTQTGRADLFRHLKPFLVEGGRLRPYAEVAGESGLTEEAVKKAVQRLRHRYGLLFREEIAHTLADPAEVEDELRYLREVISR